MKKSFGLTTLITLALVSPVSWSRDTLQRFPIADALSYAAAQSKRDESIKLYWGSQKHPEPTQRFTTAGTNKKTNFFNKTDKEGCEWAFLSALITMQERAKREGANAIVNLRSNYKGKPFESETEYECGAGNVTGGVALIGEFVKLP